MDLGIGWATDCKLNVSTGRPSGRSSTDVIMMFAKGQLKKKGLQYVFDCFSTIIQTSSFLQSYSMHMGVLSGNGFTDFTTGRAL